MNGKQGGGDSYSLFRKSVIELVLRSVQEFHTQQVRGDRQININKVGESGLYGAVVAIPAAQYLENIMMQVCGGNTLGRLAFTNLVTYPCLVLFSFSWQIWQVNRHKDLSWREIQDQLEENVSTGLLPAMKNVWLYMLPITLIVQKLFPRHLWIPSYETLSFFVGLLLKYAAILRFGNGALKDG